MKKFALAAYVPPMLLCLIVIGCSVENASSTFREAISENITRIEANRPAFDY